MKSNILSLSLLLGAAACGGNSFETGVSGDTKLSDITEQQATTVCNNAREWADDFADQNQEGLCKLTGALAASFNFGDESPEALCTTVVAQCEMQPPQNEDECVFQMTQCEATVAEYEACVNDSIGPAEDVLGEAASRSCADLTDESFFTEVLSQATQPQSCIDLEAKCPDFEISLLNTDTSTAS